MIVEAAASGLEIECAVLGNDDAARLRARRDRARRRRRGGWYDYEAKYTPGGMELVVPARIPAALAERVRALALEAFAALGCAGLARVDFFVDGDGAVLVNELNTMPGFTETSVYGKLFAASRRAVRGAARRASSSSRSSAMRASGRTSSRSTT